MLAGTRIIGRRRSSHPRFRAFIAGLAEVVDGGLLTLAHHLACHGRALAPTDREHELDVTLQI